jgi:hypothetical protein
MPKKLVDLPTKSVVFTLDKPANAAEDFVAEKLAFDLSAVNEETLIRLALHGASQKIGDSYAGAKDSGEDPLAYTKSAIEETIKQLYEGKWAVTRTGSGAPRVSILVLAYAKVKGITPEESLEVVGALDEEEKKVLQQNKKIAAAIAGLRAEQAMKRAEAAAKAAEEEDAKAAQSAQATAQSA